MKQQSVLKVRRPKVQNILGLILSAAITAGLFMGQGVLVQMQSDAMAVKILLVVLFALLCVGLAFSVCTLLHCVRNLFGDPVLVVSDSAIKLCKTEPILLSQIEEASADDTGALILRLSSQQNIRLKRSALNIPAYTIACAINIRKQQ